MTMNCLVPYLHGVVISRYYRDSNRSDRNNQSGNRSHHDNRSYHGDGGYGRKNTDHHGNRRGGGRGAYYGSPNYY